MFRRKRGKKGERKESGTWPANSFWVERLKKGEERGGGGREKIRAA